MSAELAELAELVLLGPSRGRSTLFLHAVPLSLFHCPSSALATVSANA